VETRPKFEECGGTNPPEKREGDGMNVGTSMEEDLPRTKGAIPDSWDLKIGKGQTLTGAKKT